MDDWECYALIAALRVIDASLCVSWRFMPLVLPLVGPKCEFVQMFGGKNVAVALGFASAEFAIRTRGSNWMLEMHHNVFLLELIEQQK